MSFTFDRKNKKKNKDKMEKFAGRSIDFVINSNEVNYYTKLNYIRHKYTAYDKYIHLFFDKNDKPTFLRNKLNTLLEDILNKKRTISDLHAFNKELFKLNKEYEAIKEKELNAEYDAILRYENIIKFKTEVRKYFPNNKYLPLIIAHLEDKTCKILTEDINVKKYKVLKKLTFLWARHEMKDNEKISKMLKEAKENTNSI